MNPAPYNIGDLVEWVTFVPNNHAQSLSMFQEIEEVEIGIVLAVGQEPDNFLKIYYGNGKIVYVDSEFVRGI